jgi:predicted Zn-ribbon and HTH transcriptional regulator
MAIIETYTCEDCGFKYTENGTSFFYDAETQTTRNYMMLFSTVELDADSEIKGEVQETYCKHCDKYIRTYYVFEAPEIDFKDIKQIITQGIENQIKNTKEQLDKVTEEKDDYQIEMYQNIYEKETSYINRIVHIKEHNENNTELDTIQCPNCNNEIYEFINPYYPCPKCSGKMKLTEEIDMD